MDDLVKKNGVPLQEHVFAPICSHLLKICYLIAIIDLVQSLYFLVKSFILLAFEVNLYSLIALLGSIFWICMVVLLLVGLWKSRLHFIIGWLCFSIVGVILDVLFFIWTISISDYIAWSDIIQFTCLYIGIVAEWLCVFLVYKYCLRMKSTSAIDEPEDGNIRQSNQSSELKPIDQPRRSGSMSTKTGSIETTHSSRSKSMAKPEQSQNRKKRQLKTSDKSGGASESQKPKEKDLNESKEKDKNKKRESKRKSDNEIKKKRIPKK